MPFSALYSDVSSYLTKSLVVLSFTLVPFKNYIEDIPDKAIKKMQTEIKSRHIEKKVILL